MWIIVIRLSLGGGLATILDGEKVAEFATPDEAYELMKHHILGGLPFEVIQTHV